MTELLFDARGLKKKFDDTTVLNGVDISLGRGEVLGLLGNNGAGKTTTIKIITRLLSPDDGSIRYAERDESSFKASLGVAPQETALYPRLRVRENISFFAQLYGRTGAGLRDSIQDSIELVRLESHADAFVSTLSGGMKRRLNLAVATAHRPKLIILDEPTAGLDVESRYALWDVIRGLRKAGTGILLTTHLLDEAASLCDRIAILHHGRIAREGTLEELCLTVDAEQVAEVQTEHEKALRNRATSLGYRVRPQGGWTALMLPKRTTLESLVKQLSGIGINSVNLRPVGLEDVYFHVIHDA